MRLSSIRQFAGFGVLLLCACSQTPAPISHYGSDEGVGSAGAHIVLDGDTLYSVSQRYKIPLQDIAVANGMYAPFALNVGDRITLPPPREYAVKPGDTLYSVSRVFGVTTSQVAQQNNMSAPYSLRVGQKLRVSDVASRAMARAASPQTVQTASPKASDMTTHKTAQSSTSYVIPSSKPKATPVKTRITAQTPKRSSSKFLRPVYGPVISNYGPKKDGLHNDGVNIQAPKGAPVRAAENGVVVYAGNELKGSGNLVLVRHEDRWMTAYAHMDNILVKRGQVIKRGETVGTVGSTGSVSSPQLHFEVRRGTRAINPERYIEG